MERSCNEDKTNEQQLEKLILDVCYDRKECESLGIDYCNITRGDLWKIRNYILNKMYLNNVELI